MAQVAVAFEDLLADAAPGWGGSPGTGHKVQCPLCGRAVRLPDTCPYAVRHGFALPGCHVPRRCSSSPLVGSAGAVGCAGPVGRPVVRVQAGQPVLARRVPCEVEQGHNLHDAVGVATELHSTSAVLEGSFPVATGADGDATLRLAAEGVTDGFSVEVTWTDDGDRVDDSPPHRGPGSGCRWCPAPPSAGWRGGAGRLSGL